MGNLCANRIMGGMTVRCIMNMAAGNGPREPLNGAQAGKQRHQSKLSVSQLKKKKKQDWIAQLRDTDQTVHLLFM